MASGITERSVGLPRASNKGAQCSAAGFTLVELIAVLAIVGVLAAAAIPPMIGYVVHGKQVNRDNIARTIYLAAQNQLTELRITKELKSGIASEYYTQTSSGGYEENIAALKADSVYENLGLSWPSTEFDNNRDYVQYIKKNKNDTDINNPVNRLLNPVILDKTILYDAILIEYNIKTGVVLSAFYGDTVSELKYEGEGSDSVLGGRGMGAGGYAFASSRRQGYYGVGDTGQWTENAAEALPVSVNVYDSYSRPMPGAGACRNALYADILIPEDYLGGGYDLLINDETAEANVSLQSIASELEGALNAYAENGISALMYRHYGGVDDEEGPEYARIIWVLDYVGGDMSDAGNDGVRHSIGVKYGHIESISAASNLSVGIRSRDDSAVSIDESFTKAHPYFYTRHEALYTDGRFSINSARHLYNIRYADGFFTQEDDIFLDDESVYGITNFQPIPKLEGSYTGSGYFVNNLTVNLPAESDAGLFGRVLGFVRGITMDNPSIAGNSRVGAVAGAMEGGSIVTDIYVRYNDELRGISGAELVGGIVGVNNGRLADSVFISPSDKAHISASGTDKKTIGGIAGRNNAIVSGVLFLAIAPKGELNGVTETINPIVGEWGAAPEEKGNPNKLYYLSGVGYRPEVLEYNTDITNGVGEGCGTDEMYEFRSSDLNGWSFASASIDPMNLGINSEYPYPRSPKGSLAAEQPVWSWPVVQGVPLKIDIYDSYFREMPGGEGCENALYAEILIPKEQLNEGRTYSLSINEELVADGLDLKSLPASVSALSAALNRYNADTNMHLIYRRDDSSGDENARFIWVLDYVGGNMAVDSAHSIFNKYFKDMDEDRIPSVSSNMIVRVNSAKSSTEAHPYFSTESVYVTSGGSSRFNIYSPRHLYNIRYYQKGVFTQRDDIDLTKNTAHAITAITSIPELSGSISGRFSSACYSIKNLTVDGLSETDTGLFGVVSGSVSALALENPGVSGGGNAGSVCGTLTGTVTGAYVRFTTGSERIISGSGGVGGIVGVNNGTLSHSTFISPATTVHIAESGAVTGGVVGSNGDSAVLNGILFLAVSPGDDTEIRPIAGENAASPDKLEGLYYLAGTAIRPIYSGGYNTRADNGIGTGLGTNELLQISISLWRPPLQTDETAVLDTANELYPYLHYYAVQSTFNQIATYPDWPIVEGGGEIKLSNIVYYEAYADGTYGAWFARNGSGSGSLQDNKTIAEAGYAVVVNKSGMHGHEQYLSDRYFFARNDGQTDEWTFISALEFRGLGAFEEGIANAAGLPGWGVHKLPLASLSALASNSRPLQIMHANDVNGNNSEEIYGFMHPLFAKGLYAYQDRTPVISEFYVRTPWQMQSVNTIIEANGNETAGKSFKQEINIDYGNRGIGVNGVTLRPYSDLTDSAVRGIFKGTYNGNGQSVSNVVIKGGDKSGIGLFSENGGVIRGLTLSSSVINGQEVVGGIAGKNLQGGSIAACKVSETTVSGTNVVGVAAGQNDGVITGSASEKSIIAGGGMRLGGIAGINANRIEKCRVSGAFIDGGADVGGAAGQNTGIVTETSVKDSNVQNREIYNEICDNVGGVAGDNSGTLELCLVEDTKVTCGENISGSVVADVNNVGGIAGRNTGYVLKSGVRFSTVTHNGSSNTAGGVAGLNEKVVEDVYFLSMAALDEEAVSKNNGGGIIGLNTQEGAVKHAIFLAPAPSTSTGSGNNEETIIYPIVREGRAAEKTSENKETCFYLAGNRHSFDKGNSWVNKNYNRIRKAEGSAKVTNFGGGSGLITRFVDTEWFDFYYGVTMSNWTQPSAGYPYPVIKGFIEPPPDRWPETDSPVRPDQTDRNDWAETYSTSGRAINLGFVNGDFTGDYMNRVTDYQASWGDNSIGENQGATVRVFVDGGVNGWNTRPVDPNEVGRLVSADDSSRDGPYNVDSWIELQEPINNASYSGQWNSYHHFMYTDYKGDYQDTPHIFNSPSYRYAELNAEKAGTLYQVCPTTPGQEFIYSFYHTSNIPNNVSNNSTIATDKMNFYLTGVSDDSTGLMPGDRLTLIRPCWSPRSRGINGSTINGATRISGDSQSENWNPRVKYSVAYPVAGSDSIYVGDEDLGYYRDKFLNTDGSSRFPLNNKPYIYDVWVEELGYGITFWSTQNVAVDSSATADNNTNIPLEYVNDLTGSRTTRNRNYLPSALLPDAQNNVIGYWGVSFGWKQYYGMYEVPGGQNRTEFAYQSRKLTGQNTGNYLDGVSFKSPAFLSIDKFAKMADGKGGYEDVKFIKPGDVVVMELNVKSWGEVPAHNIEITDQLAPYTDYIRFVPDSVVVTKGGVSIPVGNPAPEGDKQTLTISLDPNEKLLKDEVITIRFNVEALRYVAGTEYDISTLLYYFRNQAKVSYRNAEYKAYMNFEKKEYNASGPEPVQVFIDPVSLSSNVRTVGVTGVDPLDKGPFEVTMTIRDTLEGNNSITTTGIVSIIIPRGFEIDGDIYDAEGNAANANISQTQDSTTRVTIRDASLNASNKQEGLTYKYILNYTGNGYGVSRVNVSADYKYLFEEDDEMLSVMLEFQRPVVGIKIVARDDIFRVSDSATSILDITKNDNFKEKFADDNYDVNPVVMLCDQNGEPVTTIVDGNYQINGGDFTATLIRGSNMLQFTPVAGKYGKFDIYYKTSLVATKQGGTPESFELSSEPAKVTVDVLPPIAVSSAVKTVGAVGYDPLIDGPFEVTLTVDNTAAELTTANGTLSAVVPNGFVVSDRGTLPSNAAVTLRAEDGTTLITVPGVNMSPSMQSMSFAYTIRYTGNGYGVTYVNAADDTYYTFTLGGNTLTSTMVSSPVVGISLKPRDDEFELTGFGEMNELNVTENDNFAERLAADYYDVSPEIILTDRDGNQAVKNADGNYQIESNNYPAYRAILNRATNMLEFTPIDEYYGDYTLYYKIALFAYNADGNPESFELSSDEFNPAAVNVKVLPEPVMTDDTSYNTDGTVNASFEYFTLAGRNTRR